jgi:hypothetical protein
MPTMGPSHRPCCRVQCFFASPDNYYAQEWKDDNSLRTYHRGIVEMRNDLRQNGLCLVTQGVIGGIVTMRCEFERLHKLPLEVYSQADGDLVSSKADNRNEFD